VASDGQTIELTSLTTVTEFLGYEAAAVPRPHFRVRQMQTMTPLADGQTLMLGGLTVDHLAQSKDKVAVQCDSPLVGRLFNTESERRGKKLLVVFITATLRDAAGNWVHDPSRPAARLRRRSP